MMIDNCEYDKVKLLYKLSSISWFIENHALDNAKENGDKEMVKMLDAIRKDTDKHIERLQDAICK